MEKELYIQMRRIEDKYWWFVGKRLFIFNFIKGRPRRALDLGCGTGIMIERLNSICEEVFGVDKSLLALSCVRGRINNRKLIACDARSISIKDNMFDLVIASDILEHMPEDRIVLEEASRVLKKGGRLVITVPAFNFLWSVHDETAHHLRRYTIGLLKRKINNAGFKIEKISYTNIFAFPLVLLLRTTGHLIPAYRKRTNDFFHTPVFLNKLLIYCYKLESFLLKKINFPFGVSIIGILVKI